MNKGLGDHLKQLPLGGRGDKAEKLPLNHPILQTKCPKKKKETQSLMQLN